MASYLEVMDLSFSWLYKLPIPLPGGLSILPVPCNTNVLRCPHASYNISLGAWCHE